MQPVTISSWLVMTRRTTFVHAAWSFIVKGLMQLTIVIASDCATLFIQPDLVDTTGFLTILRSCHLRICSLAFCFKQAYVYDCLLQLANFCFLFAHSPACRILQANAYNRYHSPPDPIVVLVLVQPGLSHTTGKYKINGYYRSCLSLLSFPVQPGLSHSTGKCKRWQNAIKAKLLSSQCGQQSSLFGIHDLGGISGAYCLPHHTCTSGCGF